jgi:hypothetical protein
VSCPTAEIVSVYASAAPRPTCFHTAELEEFRGQHKRYRVGHVILVNSQSALTMCSIFRAEVIYFIFDTRGGHNDYSTP